MFNGKAIYNPAGKAGEYSKWACNFYLGCSNNCSYCYCKTGFLGRLWEGRPKLKKCFKNTEDAFRIFSSELEHNLTELRTDGIFFTFTSDPMLPETKSLTLQCVDMALNKGVPVQILTKRTEFVDDEYWSLLEMEQRKKIAFGFTLTGCDELEPGASSNSERMAAMRILHQMGYRTFASIEPVVDPMASFECIRQTTDYCDLFKVGLMSGKKDYNIEELIDMFNTMKNLGHDIRCKIYLKNSFVEFLNINRDILSERFVDVDYNIFNA